jgi:CRP-like cAMP-binding protein
MTMRFQKSGLVRNRILTSLPHDDFDALSPFLEVVDLKPRTILQEANKRADYVHFIESGIVSRVARSNEAFVETAIVGRFGFVGVSVVLGEGISFDRSIVQIPGTALRVRARDILEVMDARPHIRQRLLQYVQSLMRQNSQSVLCGIRHELEPRLARWLLLASDRLEDDILPITHDGLASLLGVRRAGVTVALAQFEAQGLVRKTRGSLQVVDRAGLEQRSCECHRIINNGYAWLKTLTHYDHYLHAHGEIPLSTF